jgi:EAL domain-containing protein (putative c-di-GMP-specific phosphodiesterase class I)/DNA-binding winged helix-turn-helix (wHTH) protein
MPRIQGRLQVTHPIFPLSTVLEFDIDGARPVQFDVTNERLHSHSTAITLTPKACSLLVYLSTRPQQLVSHQEVVRALWPDTFVDPKGLKKYVLELRKAFGDDAKHPKVIETLPRRGYRLLAAVRDASSKPKQDRNSLLAIDDDQAFLDIIERVAQERGIKASSTTDPDEFKKLVLTETPNIVVLDLNVPGLDGVALLRFLQATKCDAKILVASGMDSRVIDTAKKIGTHFGLSMLAPLQKPLRIADVRNALLKASNTKPAIDADLLRGALQNNELTVYYQPLVVLRERRLVGWEALVRWEHMELGTLTPDRFMPIAALEGMTNLVTARVLECVVSQLAEWDSLQDADEFVSVNISALDLDNAELPYQIERICKQYSVPAHHLRFELTETSAMKDDVSHSELLARLRIKGFKLALDDFGTGYSSILKLQRGPFSELKIDQAFVQHMTTERDSDIIVRTIIALAHSLDMEAIAEGIETEEQAKLLAEANCEMGQGYFFGRPMPGRNVPQWRAANSNMLKL